MRRMRLGSVLIAVGLLLAGCGSDKGSSKTASGPSRISITTTKTGKATYETKAPATAHAGLVQISFKLDAPASEDHDAQLLRIIGNHSMAEAMRIIGQEGAPTPSWLRAAGGPSEIAGGASTTVSQVLPPGTYYVVDTGEGPGDNVPSFGEQGATATLKVTGGAGDAKLPAVPATVTAQEYKFTTSGLKTGVNRVRFRNIGNEIHHAIFLPEAKGASLADVRKMFASSSPPPGPPAADFDHSQNFAAIDGGTSQVTELNLKAGKYAIVCFVSDRAGGPPHVAKGMISEVSVS
jgi:hypothetical protein